MIKTASSGSMEDAYMDISDLHTLPITLTNVVKRLSAHD